MERGVSTDGAGRGVGMRVLLVDDRLDVDWFQQAALGRFDFTVCLFWAAPETRAQMAKRTQGAVYGIYDVVGTVEQWEKGAVEIVEVVCASGPSYGGLKWRNYLDERLYGQALGLELMRRALGLIQEQAEARGEGEIAIEYVLQRDLATHLQVLRETGKDKARVKNIAPPTLTGDLEARPLLLRRLYRRWRVMRVTGGGRTQARELLAQMDSRYLWRVRGKRLRGVTPKTEAGRIGFFSSYANNSGTLAKYQQTMGSDAGAVDWVLLTDSAGRGASEVTGNKFWLWDFADGRGMPVEVQDAPTVEAESDAGRRALLERWLPGLGVWHDWVGSELPTLVQVTRFWEAYLERARPRYVVMANQWSVEGWLMLVARAHGVRVVQLMHGALGGEFYTQRPIKSDEMVVWGEFARSLFADADRDKIMARDLIDFFPKVTRSKRTPKNFTFFSWPLLQIPFYNASELWGGILDVLHEMAEAGYAVTLRLHPMENAATVVDLWTKRFGAMPPQVRVSQSEPLADVLMDTDVALMFRSTVFMDCLVNEIPVVMPGWIDFGWNEPLRGVPNVYLVSGWGELKEKTREAMNL